MTIDDLQIIKLNIDDLTPYVKNAKKHPKSQVKHIANSIETFGMCDPIGIWGENNVIVEGHGRVEACKMLGMTEVPCIRLDHLTDEQRRAYVHAHNKTAESEWDFDILDEEFNDLSGFDFEDFGFEFELEEPKPKKKNQELRTDKAYRYMDFDPERTEGKYQMPTLEPCDRIPEKMLGFNYAMSSTEFDACIHFFLDDYQFERVWNDPEKYMDIMGRYDMSLTPSYSLYLDVAEPIKIYNVFRSRLLGQMMQDNGIDVIPLVYWADEKSFDYCFDGLPESATLSTTTNGITDPEVWEHWKRGMDELIKRKKPKRILLYGNGLKVDYDFGDIEVIYYENEVTKRMRESK